MIQGLLSDPSFIPVTIVVALFVLFSYCEHFRWTVSVIFNLIFLLWQLPIIHPGIPSTKPCIYFPKYPADAIGQNFSAIN